MSTPRTPKPGGARTAGTASRTPGKRPPHRRDARPRARAVKNPYSVHPGVLAAQKLMADLVSGTGRTPEAWLDLIRRSGPVTEKERSEWLRVSHKLPAATAWLLAERSVGREEDASDPDLYLEAALRYVDEMFSGRRAALRPLYERLLEDAFALGDDVRACPCRTMVPLYRHHVFAQIRPATHSRLDLGLALGDMKTPPRLIDTAGLGRKDRITRRIEIRRIGDIDADVRRWLRTAYDRDA